MIQVTKRLLSWASILEDSTLAQARTASEMPFRPPTLSELAVGVARACSSDDSGSPGV